MRLWSFHPKYLDPVGLSRNWHEGLNGFRALVGQQEMWKNHPQLNRFKDCVYPAVMFCEYMSYVAEECIERGKNYNDLELFHDMQIGEVQIPVTSGQLEYEYWWYSEKLKKRNPLLLQKLPGLQDFEPSPFFLVVDGPVEKWEKVKTV